MLAALLAATLILTNVAAPAGVMAPSAQQSLAGKPPPTLNGPVSGGSHVRAPGIAGGVTWNIEEKSVTILWSWTHAGTSTEHLSTQVETVSFWPTAAVGLGQGRIAVAGRGALNTIIEIWTLGSVVIPQPVYPIGGGPPQFGELNVPVVRRSLVYEGATAGKETVAVLLWNPVTAAGFLESMLVQFDDSKKFYALDVTTTMEPTFTLVAEPSNSGGGPSVIVAPVLDARFDDLHVTANHGTHGIAHKLGSPVGDPSQFVVLIDTDRNGTLDLVRTLTAQQWDSESWGDATAYISFYE